jgi:hypothetical protein
MKKRTQYIFIAYLFIMLTGMFIFNSSCFGQISNLDSGLVAYYPFNGNAHDESGNGANGIDSGAVLTIDRFGNANSAYDFNGIDSYIKCSADSLPSTNRTVALWFYWIPSILQTSPLGYGGGVCGHSFLLDLGNPYIGGGKFETQGHCLTNELGVPWINQPINSWYFWVVSIDGDTIRMYINDTLIGDTNNFSSETWVNGKYLYFGCNVSPDGLSPYTDPNTTYFSGKIDDIRIYNRALTSTEIQELYYLTTGIEKYFETSDKLVIYPNPTHQNTTVVFKNKCHTVYQLTITDINGTRVYKESNISNEKIEISKGLLNPGIYILHLTGEKEFIGKLIII